MEFEDHAFVLSARAHGEVGAIVEALTASHGKFAAHVAGGSSRRMKPFLQPGTRILFSYRARVSDQLGSANSKRSGGDLRPCSMTRRRWPRWPPPLPWSPP